MGLAWLVLPISLAPQGLTPHLWPLPDHRPPNAPGRTVIWTPGQFAYAPPTHRIGMLGGRCRHLDNWPRYVHGNRLVRVWPTLELGQAMTGHMPRHQAT
jgi:hypothetical protein